MDLKTFKNYKKSKENFKSLKDKFLILYSEYENKEKIVILLEYWLWNIRSFYMVFGKELLIEFLKSDIKNLSRFSIYKITKQSEDLNFVQKNNNFKYYFLKNFYRNFYLQGANLNSLNKKIVSKLSTAFVKSIPIKKDLKLRKEIIIYSLIYFSDIDIVGFENLLMNKLPIVFFSKQVNFSKKGFQINVECAASCFLEFNNYENIFLLNKKIFIRGLQHGGGYDCFLIDYFAEFEKLLCNEFIGWGLSKINTKQHRFKAIKKTNKKESLIKRIVWVENSHFPPFYSMLLPYHHAQSKNLKSVKYIFNELKKLECEYFNLVHPVLPSDKYEKYRGKYLKRKNKKGEDMFLESDIGIFDNSSSTLIHFFIENNMPFIQIIERSEFEFFTINQKKWFDILYDYGLGFFNDEIGKLAFSLKMIIEDNYIIPNEVKFFHKKVFNSK